jgi:hypothetical protein
MAKKTERCARCNRRLRDGAQWACAIDLDTDSLGTVTELYCPKCTTTDEHTRREINDATLDYIWVGDRVLMRPKLPETYAGN